MNKDKDFDVVLDAFKAWRDRYEYSRLVGILPVALMVCYWLEYYGLNWDLNLIFTVLSLYSYPKIRLIMYLKGWYTVDLTALWNRDFWTEVLVSPLIYVFTLAIGWCLMGFEFYKWLRGKGGDGN